MAAHLNRAIGEDNVKEKILLAKPDCYVTTPVTSAIKAFKLIAKNCFIYAVS